MTKKMLSEQENSSNGKCAIRNCLNRGVHPTGQLTPLLNERQFSSTEIHDAFAAVEYGATGKVVVEIEA